MAPAVSVSNIIIRRNSTLILANTFLIPKSIYKQSKFMPARFIQHETGNAYLFLLSKYRSSLTN